MLAEEFVAAKFEEFPDNGDHSTNTNDYESAENDRCLSGFKINDGIVANNSRKHTGAEVNDFIKIRHGFIEVHTNAHIERDKEEDVVTTYSVENVGSTIPAWVSALMDTKKKHE